MNEFLPRIQWTISQWHCVFHWQVNWRKEEGSIMWHIMQWRRKVTLSNALHSLREKSSAQNAFCPIYLHVSFFFSSTLSSYLSLSPSLPRENFHCMQEKWKIRIEQVRWREEENEKERERGRNSVVNCIFSCSLSFKVSLSLSLSGAENIFRVLLLFLVHSETKGSPSVYMLWLLSPLTFSPRISHFLTLYDYLSLSLSILLASWHAL